MIKGIDVSHYEPALDWKAAYSDPNHPILFMSTKITDGVSGLDPMRFTHLNGAKAAGLVTGGYHFFHPSMDGLIQAEHFLVTCQGLPIDWFSLDFEAHENKAVDIQLSEAKAFLDKVRAVTGKTPWIYLSTSFANELGNPTWFANYPLWLANYNSIPKVPKPWLSYGIWQNSDSGTCAGLGAGHHVDTDIFNGDIDQLKALIVK